MRIIVRYKVCTYSFSNTLEVNRTVEDYRCSMLRPTTRQCYERMYQYVFLTFIAVNFRTMNELIVLSYLLMINRHFRISRAVQLEQRMNTLITGESRTQYSR
jgi:hypothetical protein